MVEFIVSYVLEKLADQLIEEAVSLSKVRNQFEWVERELRRTQCFLEDADTKMVADKRVRNWVNEIKDVAYEAEDIIDTFIFETSQKEGFMALLMSKLFISNLMAIRKANKQIEAMKKKIIHISSSRSTYGIENLGITEGRNSYSVERLREKRRSYPNVEEDIVGLEEDIEDLSAQLIQGVPRRCVVSIVGMGGLGKTTLAKKVYNSSGVKRHFDCCAWVYVAQEFRAIEILQDLAKKLMGFEKLEMKKMNKEDLKERLYQFLEEMRYLIVMDDIWSNEVWDELKEVFPDKENYSRIMLTTRFKTLAIHADPRVSTHDLHFLNDDRSWDLFSRKAVIKNPQAGLEEIGRQIVRKCGGLPLAIVTLGGLLSTKDATIGEWTKVLRSLHWQLRQSPYGCSEILSLSYNDLPYYLKPCFLYLGLFPEDSEISARRLTLLWAAEGFIQQRGSEPLEDTAEDYLEELIQRNMIEIAKRKFNGKVKTCRVHDLLRDLAVQKASQDRFFDVVHGAIRLATKSNARRLAIYFDVPPITYSPKLRSLLCFYPSERILKEVKKFILLRVLDLEGVYMPSLDKSVGNLVHLRYLGLRGTWLRKLPLSMRNLCNLETLDVRSTLVVHISHVIHMMKNLRHLYLNEFNEMASLTLPNESLVNLQTVQGICVGQSNCVKNGLDRLTALRELGVWGNFIHHEKPLVQWITKLDSLESLKLRHTCTDEHPSRTHMPKLMPFTNHKFLYKLHLEGMLENLLDLNEFPPNLTELSLQTTVLQHDPMSTLERLPNLRILKLKYLSYVGKEMVCSSGGFPHLQSLKLSFLNTLEEWRIEEGAMQKLTRLEIIDCKRIRHLSERLQTLTSLCELKLGCLPREFDKMVQHMGTNCFQIENVLPL